MARSKEEVQDISEKLSAWADDGSHPNHRKIHVNGTYSDYILQESGRSYGVVWSFSEASIRDYYGLRQYERRDWGGKLRNDPVQARRTALIDRFSAADPRGNNFYWLDSAMLGEHWTLFPNNKPLLAITRPDYQRNAEEFLIRNGFKMVFEFEGNEHSELKMWMRRAAENCEFIDGDKTPPKTIESPVLDSDLRSEGFKGCCGARSVFVPPPHTETTGLPYPYLSIAEVAEDDHKIAHCLQKAGLVPYMKWIDGLTGSRRVLYCGFAGPHLWRRRLDPA